MAFKVKYPLEYLSIVSKICKELESHPGFGDKSLAEFIIELGLVCETVDVFNKKLKENGAHMPDYVVRNLLRMIHDAIILPHINDDNGKERRRRYMRSLSVDQNTGEDLLPLNKKSLEDGISGIKITTDDAPPPLPLKRMSSSLQQQMIAASGVKEEHNNIIMFHDDCLLNEEEEEELEIELNEDKPAAFLNGQTPLDMSPIKIFKYPMGSLSRAAALAQEMREVRRQQQQQRTMLNSIPKGYFGW